LGGILLEDGNVVVPGGLGGVVGGHLSVVQTEGGRTGGVLNLGNLGWEVSHLSQVEWCVIVFTVVCESNRGFNAGRLNNIGGDWDVGDVSVELGCNRGERCTSFFGVGDWGSSWGQP